MFVVTLECLYVKLEVRKLHRIGFNLHFWTKKCPIIIIIIIIYFISFKI